MRKARSKKIDIKTEVKVRVEDRKPIVGEKVVMRVREMPGKCISTRVVRAGQINCFNPYIVIQAIIPKLERERAKIT